jgi:pilus assembly protein Flp/PilA
MGHSMIKKFIQDESGATAIEYGLIAVLLSLAVIAGAQVAGTKLLASFTLIATKLI